MDLAIPRSPTMFSKKSEPSTTPGMLPATEAWEALGCTASGTRIGPPSNGGGTQAIQQDLNTLEALT